MIEDQGSFKDFKRRGSVLAMPWTEEVNMEGISVSDVDRQNGSPKEGDMICCNPDNTADQWLVATEYFRTNYQPVG
jgi:hypothetical protein